MGNSKMLTKFLQISKETLRRASPRLPKPLHGKLSTFQFNILCQHLASVHQLVKCLEKPGTQKFMAVGNMYLCEKYTENSYIFLSSLHISTYIQSLLPVNYVCVFMCSCDISVCQQENVQF